MDLTMFAQLTSSPFFLAASILVLFGIILTIIGFVALLRAQISSFALRSTLGLLLLAIGGIAGMIALGINGYQTLTREKVAARLSVSPVAPQRFSATFRYPDGRVANFIIAGDEIYVDAHILKWQPLANLFGLHTAYELDRVGGRYRDIEQERSAERTIHSLSENKLVNLFDLRERHTFLSPLMDAKYGSATFVPVIRPAELELKVTTTGLMMRELSETPKLPDTVSHTQ